MTGVWFGDIGVAFITDKDTDISKNNVDKNFVDNPPVVYGLTSDIESGSYNIGLHEELHPRSETFKEQRDGVRSMVERSAGDLPFDMSGDQGHLVVEGSTTSITPSAEIERASIDIRFLNDSEYQPAFLVKPGPFDGEYEPTPVESLIPIPSEITSVDADGVSATSNFTVTTEDGDMEYYKYSSEAVFSYDIPNSIDYTLPERIAPVRVTDDGERIYSTDRLVETTPTLSNGIIEAEYNSTQVDFSVYDSSWSDIGNVSVSRDEGYPATNTNYKSEVSFLNGYDSTMYRGYPAVQFDIDGISDFTFNPSPALASQDESTDHYRS